VRIGLIIVVALAGSPALAAGGGDVVAPASLRLAASAQAALDRGQPSVAIDTFEAALAVDPKNERAFVGLGRVYASLGLPGRAIKYYREALALQPNDLVALEDQGRALIARGATERAKTNLARIKTLCAAADCPAARRLEIAIAAPAPLPAKTAAVEVPKPVTVKN